MAWFFRNKSARPSEPAAPTIRSAPRRVESRASIVARRSYQGAALDRTTQDWMAPVGSADFELYRSLRKLRARWRDLDQNNEYAHGFLKAVRRHVIGPQGIRFKNRAKNAKGELLKDINAAIEDAFADWSRRSNCTADGMQSWLDVQGTWIKSLARDGENLIRLIPGFENKHGFAIQLLEADFLDETYNLAETAPGATLIRMGVELDKWGRPVAYHLFDRHPGEWGFNPSPGNGRSRLPAEIILHCFVIDRPGQTRGVPWGHAAMVRLRQLGMYEQYALIAARVGAAKMGFLEEAEAQGVPFEGEEKDERGNIIADTEPGAIERLPRGTVFKEYNPDYPRGEMPFFCKLMLRGVAVGVGMSYNSLGADLEHVNYSSLRGGLLEERDEWKVLQQFAIEHLCDPIVAAWLPCAVLAGAVKIPFAAIDDYLKPVWRPRGWAWVDPSKEVDGATRAVALGIGSRTAACAATGRDFEEVLEELADEQASAAALGYELVTPIPAGALSAPPVAADLPASPPADEPGDDSATD